MAALPTTFTIDTEVAPVYLNDLLAFTYQYYLIRRPDVFVNVRWGEVDGVDRAADTSYSRELGFCIGLGQEIVSTTSG